MPDPAFKGDPYAVLGVMHSASTSEIKRRWRDLALEHHPDRGAFAGTDTRTLTTRMARINAAYDLLRDPARRARYDASPGARRSAAAQQGSASRNGRGRWREEAEWTDEPGPPSYGPPSYGPPSPPPARPVTARFDTTAAYHGRNTTTCRESSPLRGHPPISRRRGESDLRASTPTGPISRRWARGPRQPSLDEARSTLLEFGRFHGFTLGEVAELEPTYIDWIARTITRDRDLVMRARVMQTDLDGRGVEGSVRPNQAGRAKDEAEPAVYEAHAVP